MSRTRGNKAKRDKGSILADVKNLLYVLHPAIQHMPKIERIEGAPVEMKRACYDLIRHFTVAIECQEVRLANIHQMFGELQRRCLVYLPQYSVNERLNTKYHLKLKHYDTIRNHRAEERSLQRTQHTGVAA